MEGFHRDHHGLTACFYYFLSLQRELCGPTNYMECFGLISMPMKWWAQGYILVHLVGTGWPAVHDEVLIVGGLEFDIGTAIIEYDWVEPTGRGSGNFLC
jgi:hypothetical protein